MRTFQILLFVVLIAAGLGSATAVAEQFTARLENASGETEWRFADQWSTAPYYPNNGRPSAEDTYDVIVDWDADPYRVTLNGPITVDNLLINAPRGSVEQQSGNFTIQERLDLRSGKFAFQQGRLTSATIVVSGGQFEIIPDSDPAIRRTFDGVILQSDIVVPYGAGSLTPVILFVEKGIHIGAGHF